jgi:hypothetical protein
MANTPARFRQCELRRAQKVAEECGCIVKIQDGAIYLVSAVDIGDIGGNREKQLEPEPEGYL